MFFQYDVKQDLVKMCSFFLKAQEEVQGFFSASGYIMGWMKAKYVSTSQPFRHQPLQASTPQGHESP